MPRVDQIVPKYWHPHEETYVTDNSIQDLSEDTITEVTYPYICVFAGPKGPDGKLINIKSWEQHQKTFGKTNFKKYGQPNMMPEAILSQQHTETWSLRVMPDDALYANNVLSLWYKPDVENRAFRIKFTTKSIGLDYSTTLGTEKMRELLADKKAIEELAQEFDGTPVDGQYVDEEGYIQVPCMVFISPGRGLYGNNLRWRIIPATDFEREYKIKVFRFEAIDVEEGATIVKHHIGALTTTTKIQETILINDLVDDTDIEFQGVYMHLFEENMDDLYDAYTEFCAEVLEAEPSLEITIPERDEFDPFFGMAVRQGGTRVTPPEPFIKFTNQLTADIDQGAEGFDAESYSNATNLIQLNSAAGNALFNGSDGAFDTKDTETLEALFDACYMKAFSGGYDKLITAPKRIPSTSLFDANFSMETKMALARLAMIRQSGPVYLDTNMRDSLGMVNIYDMEFDFSPLDDLINDYENFDSAWCVSVNTHWYMIKENSTGRRIPVTITYWLAAGDADFIRIQGINSSRTNSLGLLTGHIKDSLKPTIEENEEDIKNALNEARVNYFEATGKNVFERCTQNMFVHEASDLLEENNVRCLFWLKETLEAEARGNRYAVSTPAKRAEFRQFLLNKYDYTIGTLFNSLDIRYTSNRYEQKRNIVHMFAAITFFTIAKISLIEIDVNKREYQPDEEEES